MIKNNNKIFVTEPTLPPLTDYVKFLEKIWKNKWITNKGEFHKKFEKKICNFLRGNNCSLCANGTLALIIALKSLDIKGEVITTPFSFVATANAIHWAGGTPVFCDIENNTLNINPEKIESMITKKTTAILPVHVYGNPCDVKRIKEIAEKHDLKLIYDSAHAFKTMLNNESILQYGDISVMSFHATKVFNTIEGGAIFTKDKKLKNKIDFLCNFGFSDKETIIGPGINAKMNEIQAAYGLICLKIINEEIEKRKKIADFYRGKIKDINGIKIMNKIKGVTHSNPYFPILINKEKFGISRDELYESFKKKNIYTRKYFYPLISHFKPYRCLSSASSKNLKVAEKIANAVLCLPIYGNLSFDELNKIVDIIMENR